MGAIQAQDLNMAKLALALRSKESVSGISKSLQNQEIIRAHILRPTWHFIAREDYLKMNRLSAPYVKKIIIPQLKNLGVTFETLLNVGPLLAKFFQTHPVCAREDISALFGANSIPSTSIATGMILMYYELEQMVIQDYTTSLTNAYSLLSIDTNNDNDSELDSAVWLAKKYFTSHGPATIQDFKWWSGLPAGLCTQVEKSLAGQFNEIEYNGRKYYFNGDLPVDTTHQAILLPAYDEMLISYTNRSHALADEHLRKVVTSNGIFRPVVLQDNKVKAIWKKDKKHFNYEKIETDFNDQELKQVEEYTFKKLS